MFRSWKFGGAFGIPLYVHPTFLLLLALTSLSGPGGLVGSAVAGALLLAVFSCILLHELGHALMARHFGIGTRDITLYPIGGVARLERFHEDPFQEICIALAGPAVNFAIVLLLAPVCVGLVMAGGLASAGLEWPSDARVLPLATQFTLTLGLANVFLMLFNLVPAFPMDGGRVLRAGLTPFLGSVRATEVAVWLGLFLSGGMVALAITFAKPMLVLLALFLVVAGRMELLALRLQHRQQATIVAALPVPPPPSFMGCGLLPSLPLDRNNRSCPCNPDPSRPAPTLHSAERGGTLSMMP